MFDHSLLKVTKLYISKTSFKWDLLLQLYPSVENVRTSLEGYPGKYSFYSHFQYSITHIKTKLLQNTFNFSIFNLRF